ncbi:hypothetical protein PPYR_06695 [Photinus pyralis]|uniref:Nose resistant-to-fluoxetine protein N-terminal domain-containing protein n=1 Tax=Photinus pyralis TaxID=7054 RepID=A0A5N4AN88_PHOPY|nr:hypothetical protein PPYR_06695 [Photinus pyralis]
MYPFSYMIFVTLFLFPRDNYGQIQSILDGSINIRKLLFSSEDPNTTRSYPVSEKCSNYLQLFSTAVLEKEIWALEMLDASSGVQSGILKGNLVNFGSYDECININAHTRLGVVNGKYCRVEVKINSQTAPDGLELDFVLKSYKTFNAPTPSLAVCVPDACSEKDVENLLRAMKMDPLVKEGACKTQYTKPPLDYKGKALLYVLT